MGPRRRLTLALYFVVAATLLLALRMHGRMSWHTGEEATPSPPVREPPRRTAGPSNGAGVRAGEVQGYLLIGNTFGRHNNQMVSITAAIALAARLGRTAVLPPLFFGGGKGGGGRLSAPPHDVFAMDRGQRCVPTPSGPQCVVEEAEFVRREGTALSAGCLRMRGVPLVPRHPAGAVVTCGATADVRFKKRLPLLLNASRALHRQRYLMVPLAMYAAAPLRAATDDAWRHFRPSPDVAAAVAALYHDLALQPAVSTATGAVVEAPVAAPVVGLHVRSLEGDCGTRSRTYVLDAVEMQGGAPDANQSAVRAALREQCRVEPRHVLRDARRHAAVRVLIADDGQDPAHVAALGKALHATRVPALRACDGCRFVRYVDSVREAQRRRQATVATEAGAVALSPFLVRGGAVALDFFRLQVDFWALVGVDVFVGNQLSTVSVNVCRVRRSRGRACDNFHELGPL